MIEAWGNSSSLCGPDHRVAVPRAPQHPQPSTLHVMDFRACSRVACQAPAVATLTFDYSEALAVLGPLAVSKSPHSFDLCQRHARLTTVPAGWSLMRHTALGGEQSEL